jgi:hypothetical protein
MRVEDYYTQGRQGWVRLHEKGGKRHEMPCRRQLEAYLDAYITRAARWRRASKPAYAITRSGRPASRNICAKSQIDSASRLQYFTRALAQ